MLFIFRHNAAVDDNVFIRGIEFDDAAADLLLDQFLHLGCISHAAARGRHKRTHSDIDAQATLHNPRNRAHNRGFIGEGPFQRGPVGGACSFASRELVIAPDLPTFDCDLEFIARFHCIAIVLKLRKGQNPFGLEPKINKHRVGRNRHDRAFAQSFCGFRRVALFELRKNRAEGLT